MKQLEIITLNKPGITDFAKERNLLLKKSKSEWALFVDTDEIVNPELMKEVKGTISKAPNLNAYYIKRKIFFLGIPAGEDKVLRLVRRGTGKWKRAVHEVWDVRQRFGTLSGYMIHNTGNNLTDYVAKINFYSDIHAKENKKEKKRVSLLKIVLYPGVKFFQNIFSGRGFVFSMLQSFHSFLGWTKQWELENK